MRISAIEPFVCDGGWREFIFVKVTTDEGLVGWSEAYDWSAAESLAEAIRHIGREFIGEDPRRTEWLNERVWYAGRPGVPERMKVLAALDIACLDIKGQALGVPVYDLIGGLYRARIPLYWSHFATHRMLFAELLGTPPATSIADWVALADEPLRQGFAVIKTNLLVPGNPPRLPAYRDGIITPDAIDAAVNLVGALREKVGPKIGISLDVQFEYRMGGIIDLARALEPFGMYWLEVESFDPDALLAARRATRTRLCHGESLIRREAFRPFFEKHVTDVVMIETLANGLTESRKIAELAALYDVMVSPHNWMSPLGTAINAQLCAAIPNVEILEIDIDDLPWKMDYLDRPLEIERGELIVSQRPGLGFAINEDAVKEHPLPRRRPRA